MANNNYPTGLMSLGICLSGENPKIRPFLKAVGYATAIFSGDAVNQVADGTIEASATPGTTLFSGVSLNHGAALTATSHSVVVTPDALYLAQSNGALVAADEGLNANLVLTAGDPVTKRSKHQIGASTKDVTATLDLKLIGLHPIPENEYGAYARFVVAFNKHRMASGVVGV